ncbi:ATP-binding protein [Vagococcus lutrae]|uniref:ATP-binding protein n=1 Tax=Vagococcus lutrae TaxID=81947 RepID=UPI002891AAF0|nr:ATP-binding protein [Vagococcus lutrae]MDT2801914.1 ATP-binding protein [Vagococcus lutrae]
MTQQNTTTFSNVGNMLQEKLKETDEICPVHKINLISAFGREPICMECSKEDVAKRDREIVDKAMKEHLKCKTYHWLERYSVFLDATLKKAGFDSYRTDCEETARNKELALKIAREYFAGATYNTIFTGKPGTGKSHLSMSMLKVVNEHSDPYRKCLFVSIDELMRRIKDSFNNKDSRYTEQRMIQLLTEADLLVIDDLGAEVGAIDSDKRASNFITKTLYAIVNGRQEKPTIITTNLNSKELSKMYDRKLISRMFRGADGHVIQFKNTTDKRISVEF